MSLLMLALFGNMIWFFIGRFSTRVPTLEGKALEKLAKKMNSVTEKIVDTNHPSSGVMERPTAADLKARDPDHQKEVEAWKKSLGQNFGKKSE